VRGGAADETPMQNSFVCNAPQRGKACCKNGRAQIGHPKDRVVAKQRN